MFADEKQNKKGSASFEIVLFLFLFFFSNQRITRGKRKLRFKKKRKSKIGYLFFFFFPRHESDWNFKKTYKKTLNEQIIIKKEKKIYVKSSANYFSFSFFPGVFREEQKTRKTQQDEENFVFIFLKLEQDRNWKFFYFSICFFLIFYFVSRMVMMKEEKKILKEKQKKVDFKKKWAKFCFLKSRMRWWHW